jgi:hypothetical protein
MWSVLENRRDDSDCMTAADGGSGLLLRQDGSSCPPVLVSWRMLCHFIIAHSM